MQLSRAFVVFRIWRIFREAGTKLICISYLLVIVMHVDLSDYLEEIELACSSYSGSTLVGTLHIYYICFI